MPGHEPSDRRFRLPIRPEFFNRETQMITKLSSTWLNHAMVLALVGAALSVPVAAAKAGGWAGPVKVTLKYTGSGTVDATHKLWVWLFDTPNIGEGSIPIAEFSLDTNGGTATFESVGTEQVWVAVAYDVHGNFTGSAPPPPGSPVALYSENGKPSAVSPGIKA